MQSAGAAHSFEAVKLGRIMAAGNHDRAVGLEMHGRKIEQRSGDSTDVRHVASGGKQTFEQSVVQTRRAEAADRGRGYVSSALALEKRPQSAPELNDIGLWSSVSATPRMSYSRKMVDFSIPSDFSDAASSEGEPGAR